MLFRSSRDESLHLQRLSPDQNGEYQEDDVFDECLHIGEHYGITEASAILYWAYEQYEAALVCQEPEMQNYEEDDA